MDEARLAAACGRSWIVPLLLPACCYGLRGPWIIPVYSVTLVALPHARQRPGPAHPPHVVGDWASFRSACGAPGTGCTSAGVAGRRRTPTRAGDVNPNNPLMARLLGAPPRVRGTLSRSLLFAFRLRRTPTRAGDAACRWIAEALVRGAPPRVRGTLQDGVPRRRALRTTAHPHACGGDGDGFTSRPRADAASSRADRARRGGGAARAGVAVRVKAARLLVQGQRHDRSVVEDACFREQRYGGRKGGAGPGLAEVRDVVERALGPLDHRGACHGAKNSAAREGPLTSMPVDCTTGACRRRGGCVASGEGARGPFRRKGAAGGEKAVDARRAACGGGRGGGRGGVCSGGKRPSEGFRGGRALRVVHLLYRRTKRARAARQTLHLLGSSNRQTRVSVCPIRRHGQGVQTP